MHLQEDILAHLKGIGGSIEMAEQILRQFREVLEMHRQHLARLEARLVAGASAEDEIHGWDENAVTEPTSAAG